MKLNINFQQRTILMAIFSAAINLAFIVYYSYLGLNFKDGFAIGISTYYFLLFLIKTITLLIERIIIKKDENSKLDIRLKNYKISSIFIFVLDLCLIAPIILMVINPKEVSFGIIPAIAMAAYCVYKITISIVGYRKSKKSNNPTIVLFKEINIIGAVVSILTLQHTLIMVNGGMTNNMRTLSLYTSVAFIIVIISFSIISFRKNQKLFNQAK